MASTHYDDVRNALVVERDQSSGDQKLTCIDLLQRIDEWNQTQIDKGIGFELALALTDWNQSEMTGFSCFEVFFAS